MTETKDADADQPTERRISFDLARKPSGRTESMAARLVSRLAPAARPGTGTAAATVAAADAAGDGDDTQDDGAIEEDVPRPLTEESLASMVAGRRLETEEEERTFLLTLSRDQRLKYAELLNASDRLDLDRENHNLEVDRIELAREQMVADEIGRFRANAFAFATSGIRTMLAVNGGGAIVLLGVWGYLAALPEPPFFADAFVLALTAFGIGTVASAFTALAAYAAQAVRARPGHTRLRRAAGEAFRVLAVILVAAGFLGFLAGILLAAYGLAPR